MYNNKQLLDQGFFISGIIKVKVSVVSCIRLLRLVTLTETLIILDITETKSNNCFIIHCFKENKDKCIMLKQFDHPYHIIRELDIALGNHVLHAQPTDYSLIC